MDQFIEKNLDKEDQDFARLCVSMCEELDAINRYQQRIAAGSDANAVAVWTAAQTEEMKHFAMELEAALRIDKDFRTICQTILFTTDDIVEAGVKAEQAVEEK